MSFLTRLFGKKRKNLNLEVTRLEKKEPEQPKTDSGTTVRKPKEPELTALEMADDAAWEVKALPERRPGDVILDTYEIEDVFSGGMGHVYIAYHNKWKVKLAIKAPNEKMLSHRDMFARILREAGSWTDLGLHPNIAYCYTVRNIEAVPHIFIEYVDGGNLKEWIEDGKCIDFRTNLDLAIQFCHGMEHAHSKGMIHRDIKPENVLMTSEGTPKITDFGLVRVENSTLTIQKDYKRQDEIHDDNMTTVGTIMGSRGYMAPEQYHDPHGVDERADIFSFGIVLFEMFCGAKPYEITFGDKQEIPDPVKLSGVKDFPEKLSALLTKTIQWEPEDRYTNFEQIRMELNQLYQKLYQQESIYAELKLVDIEADGLNNRGISHWELGHKADARACWEKALEVNPTHLEATYNLGLIQWRAGEIADDEVLRRLDNIENNPAVDNENHALLKARVYAESHDLQNAHETLDPYPGRYDSEFKRETTGDNKCTREINCGVTLSVSDDSRYAVSRDGEHILQYWDLEAGICMQTMEHPGESIVSASITKDGRFAISGGSEGAIHLWNLKTGRCVRSMAHSGCRLNSICISEDGKLAVAGGSDKLLRLWDLETGQCIRSMEGHNEVIISVCLLRNDRFAVSSQQRTTLIKLWDLESGNCVRTIMENCRTAYLAVTPDGRLAASGCMDKTVRLWDLETGRCIHTLNGHVDWVTTISVSSDGKYAVSGSWDRTTRFWDFKTCRCVRTLKEKADSVFMSPDSRTAVLGGAVTRLWSLELDNTYRAEHVISIPKNYEKIINDGQLLDERIHKANELYKKEDYTQSFAVLFEAYKDIDFRNNRSISDLYGKLLKRGRIKGLTFAFQKKILDTENVGPVKLSVDGRFAVSASSDDTLRVWALESGRCVCSIEAGRSLISEYSRLSLSPDGRYAVVCRMSKLIQLWDLKTGRCVRALEGHSDYVKDVCFTPDSLYAVSIGETSVRLWELATGRCENKIAAPAEDLDAVYTTADSRYVIVRDWNKSIHVWDLSDGRWISTIERESYSSRGWQFCITPDSRFGISNNNPNTLSVWELSSSRIVRTLEGHTNFISAISVTPDGRYIVSGSEDTTARVWDFETGNCLHVLEGHTGLLKSMVFTSDNRYAVTSGFDETLRIWDLVNGSCLTKLVGHGEGVTALDMTPESQYIVSGGFDNTLRLWELVWDLEFE